MENLERLIYQQMAASFSIPVISFHLRETNDDHLSVDRNNVLLRGILSSNISKEYGLKLYGTCESHISIVNG